MARKQQLTIPSAPFGAYQPMSILGHGGMGVVYRARHTENQEEVALKTLHTVDTAVLARMRREIASLARLRHPGVVEIVEHGVQEGCPWYAMELIDGLTLSQLCKLPQFDTSALTARQHPELTLSSHTGPLTQEALTVDTQGFDPHATNRIEVKASQGMAHIYEQLSDEIEGADPVTRRLRQMQRSPASEALTSQPLSGNTSERPSFPTQMATSLLTLVRRICGPLAYLHGEGVVHRDLKPGNLLFLSSGHPIIVDFGLSADLGGENSRERLHDDFATYGTPGYMAPEQILGQAVDARCDLYALGCILFKLLTGRLPYKSKDPMEVYRLHLKQKPPRLSDFYTDVPDNLQLLLDQLLAKSPNDRLGYALDVAARLVEVGATDEPLPGPPPRAYLYLPGFVGRSRTLAQMEQWLEAPTTAPPVMFLEGESGVGKTRVLLKAMQRAQSMKHIVFSGRSQPPIQTDESTSFRMEPLSSLRKPLRALADRCWERGKTETLRLFGKHRLALLASFEPQLRTIPGGLTERNDHAQPEQLPQIDAHHRLLDAFLQSMSAAANGGRALLVLDDMQWADPLTLQLLKMFIQSRREEPIRILAAYRPEEAPAALIDLANSVTVDQMSLPRLDAQDIEGMIKNMLAVDAPPEAFVESVHRSSQGIPFFAVEYLNVAVEQAYIKRDRQGLWQFKTQSDKEESVDFSLPLPSSIQQLMEQRLSGLENDELALLEWSAAWGKPFHESLPVAWGVVDEAVLQHLLGRLSYYQLLEEISPSVFYFTHEPMQGVVYGTLSVAQRTTLHVTMATALENASTEHRTWSDADLAYHWHQAGHHHNARQAYLTAAREAIARSSLFEAESLLALHLELTTDKDDLWLQAQCTMATDILLPKGSFREAQTMLEECLKHAQAQQLSDWAAKAQLHLGFALHGMGKIDTATTALNTALLHFESHEQPRGKASALRYLGVIQAQQGFYDEAISFFERSLAIWDKIGDLQEQGLLLNNLGSIHLEQSQNKLAEMYYTNAIALFNDNEEYLSIQGKLLNNLSMTALEQGNVEQAVYCGERSLTIRRKLGDRIGEGYVLNNLSYLAYRQRDYAKAYSISHEASAVWQDIKHPRGEAYQLINMGCVRRDLRDYEGAMECFARGLNIAEEIQNPHLQGHAQLYKATCFRYQQLWPEAQMALDKAHAVFHEGHQGQYLQCIVEQGLLDMAQGGDAEGWLVKAEEFARESNSMGDEWLEALGLLQRAVAAANQGDPLLLGQVPEDLPPLVRHGVTSTS